MTKCRDCRPTGLANRFEALSEDQKDFAEKGMMEKRKSGFSMMQKRKNDFSMMQERRNGKFSEDQKDFAEKCMMQERKNGFP